MTQLLQLLVFVGAIAGLIAYGFHRDKIEHSTKQTTQDQQLPLYFDSHDKTEHREGAAMSRVR